VTTPSEPPPSERAAAHPLPLQLELPPAPAPSLAPPPKARRLRTGRGRRWLVRSLLGAAIAGAGALAIIGWVLPWYVRRQCIEEAAAHGITLSIDSAEMSGDGFRLLGVRATAADVPGAYAQAPEIRVQTSGLRPQTMTIRGGEVGVEGSWGNVAGGVAKWRASPDGGQAGAWAPVTLVLDESRIVWQGLIGEAAKVEANDLHVQVAWNGRAAEVHARSDRVLVGVPGGRLGPWRVDLDRVPAGVPSRAGGSRLRIALDPGVPDSSTVLVLGDDDRTTSVDVSVPRSPLARLGIPPQVVGLRGKDLQAEVVAHYREGALGPSRADASTKGGLYGIEAPGIPRPLDVSWEAAASGSPDAGLDLRNARLAVGPLVGAMNGTLKAYGDGFRVDLAWSAGPVPCKAFDTPLGSGTPFDIAFQLRKLAEATGLTRIDGAVTARASLTFDSRDLGSTRVDFAPDAKCQVAIFAP
jgi:hypothetical protein